MKALVFNLFNRLCVWLHQVMSEDNGNPSSMRLVLVVWHLAVAGVWTFLCLSRRELVHIDESILALLGGMTGLKLGQKIVESKAPAPGS